MYIHCIKLKIYNTISLIGHHTRHYAALDSIHHNMAAIDLVPEIKFR